MSELPKIMLNAAKPIAVGLSGGPDSMALCAHLSALSKAQNGPEIHALIVDHGLRPESAAEAAQVASWGKHLPFVNTHILTRVINPNEPISKIQESARDDRYALMADYCKNHGISDLYLAHHQDDQAETFLFRLAKGSGLDGLSSMRREHAYNSDLTLVRPFLNVAKSELVTYCDENGMSYITDPSNENEVFARVRLRKSADALAEEGLTSKRLAVTARRLNRARHALDHYAGKAFDAALIEKNEQCLMLNMNLLSEEPSETRWRVVKLAIENLTNESGYGPRREKLENLVTDLFAGDNFKPRTLGGVIFSIDQKSGILRLEKEK